jgi:hypothetical protein
MSVLSEPSPTEINRLKTFVEVEFEARKRIGAWSAGVAAHI